MFSLLFSYYLLLLLVSHTSSQEAMHQSIVEQHGLEIDGGVSLLVKRSDTVWLPVSVGRWGL